MKPSAPNSFRDRDYLLTLLALLVGGGSSALVYGSGLESGVVWLLSAGFGTILFAVIPTPRRALFTAMFALTLFAVVSVVRTLERSRWDAEWFSDDWMLAFAMMFAFTVVLPVIVAWGVTKVRRDDNRAA